MAQKITTTFVDDLTGDEIPEGRGGTVRFGFEGTQYEIDLSDENRDAIREALSDYIAAGRKVGSRSTGSGSARGTSARSDASELAKIREWAAQNGYEVSSRGRIAQAVRDAYNAAH